MGTARAFRVAANQARPAKARPAIRAPAQTAAFWSSGSPLSELGVDRGGLFSFFSQDNPEMLIKVLDACALNHQCWVFYAAGTDVGLRVTVTDLRLRNTKTYTNPRGTAALPVLDTEALPCR